MTETQTEPATEPESRKLRLNSAMHAADTMLQQFDLSPEEQIGVLFMVHVLALRRLLERNKITDRGRRYRIIKMAVAEFGAKLRTYAVNPEKIGH